MIENKPIVLSYCSTFLKPEMLHIYRQITGLQRYKATILTRSRENHEQFPFSSVIEMPKPKTSLISHFYNKYIHRLEPLLYRGEYDQLLGFVNREQVDLLHVYFGHTGVHLLPFLKRWNKPKIVSFHGMDVMPRAPKHQHKLKELFDCIDLVLTRSDSLKQKLLVLGCAEKKIRLNRTGIPMASFPRVQRIIPQDGKWQLVQVCRFIEKKGIEDSIQAFSTFRRQFPEAQLHLVGDGPLRNSLQKLAQSLHLGNSLHFHGFRNQDYVYNLLAQSHIFLHPSCTTSTQDQEGIPNSMLEAMATGMPIVATRHSGIPEAVTDGKDGLLVEERNWEALAQCLDKIVTTPDRWTALGTAAAASVRDKFDQATQINNLERLYDEVRGVRSM